MKFTPKFYDSTIFYLLEHHIIESLPIKIINPVWDLLVNTFYA